MHMIYYKKMASSVFTGLLILAMDGCFLAEVYYGVRTVIVNKETDTCEWFAAQDIDNEKLIENGNIVDFPNEYKYKAS